MHSSPHWKDTLTSRQMDHTDPRHRLHAPDTPDDTQKDAPHSLAHKTQTTKLHTIHSLRTRAAFSTLFLRPVLLQHRPVAMLLSVASLDLGAPASLDNRPRTLLCCCCCCSRPHCDSHNTLHESRGRRFSSAAASLATPSFESAVVLPLRRRTRTSQLHPISVARTPLVPPHNPVAPASVKS